MLRKIAALYIGCLMILLSIHVVSATFNDTDSYDTFSFTSNFDSTHAGYIGTASDGIYIYYAPNNNGSGTNDNFVRYDTRGNYTDATSWESYSPKDAGVGSDPQGYAGALFDNRYIYFIPFINGSGWNSEVLRFDTLGDFNDALKWDTFDMTTIPGATSPTGYLGGTFDGQYLYFAPYRSDGNGEFVRFDTTGDFTSTGSWSTFIPLGNGVSGSVLKGYHDATYDGQYVYFAPYNDGTNYHGEVLRYDTQGAGFASSSAWTSYDPGANGVGTDPDGYVGAGYDGQYVYFAPFHNGTALHGEVLRYDTQGAGFTNSGAWSAYDASGIGTDTVGFTGVEVVDNYVYFIPFNGKVSPFVHEILRFHTTGTFSSASDWESYDLLGAGVTGFDGQFLSVFEHPYIYMAPYRTGTSGIHGVALRYDVRIPLTLSIIPSNPLPSVTNVLYNLQFTPNRHIDNGDKIVLSVPDALAGALSSMTNSDIAATGTNITSKSAVIDANAQTITITLTTSAVVEGDISIVIGDGLTGGLNDFTNPSIEGGYTFGLEIISAENVNLESGSGAVAIGTGIQVAVNIAEAIVMTISNSAISLQVDPSVNGGKDVSKYTVLTVASNARGGYAIYGKLDDGSGNAQLASGANTIATGTGENNFGFEAKNANYDSGESVNADSTFSGTLTQLQSNSQDIGLTQKTNAQSHTIYYDLDVDYSTVAGIYSGTLTYTIVASF